MSYQDRLQGELDNIQSAYADILAQSAIVNVDPNRHRSDGPVFIGFAR